MKRYCLKIYVFPSFKKAEQAIKEWIAKNPEKRAEKAKDWRPYGLYSGFGIWDMEKERFVRRIRPKKDNERCFT
jgi:hypothetical protein